jgi:hypothetical protein
MIYGGQSHPPTSDAAAYMYIHSPLPIRDFPFAIYLFSFFLAFRLSDGVILC